MFVLVAILFSIYHEERGRLSPLVERLPFDIDDVEAVNKAYLRWRDSRSEEVKENVLVWGYCYVYDYFLTRFVHERVSQASDFDYLVSRVYTRIQNKLPSVKDPARFAQWVSVICCNALKNFRRDRKEPAEEVEETFKALDPEGTALYDRRLTRRALLRAFDTLPPAQQEVAQMKLIDHLEYKEIEERTDRSIGTVRSLMAKALTRLRQHPELRALYLGTDLDA